MEDLSFGEDGDAVKKLMPDEAFILRFEADPRSSAW